MHKEIKKDKTFLWWLLFLADTFFFKSCTHKVKSLMQSKKYLNCTKST